MLDDSQNRIKQIREGKIEEFEKIFKELYPQLCLYALRFVKRKDLSEEIVQNIFCQIWENRSDLNIHTSIKAYLYRSTYNNALQALRKDGSHNKYKEYIKHHYNENNSSANKLEEKEINEIVHKTLLSLPQRCGIIFKMSRFEGLKYQEIAQKLSISIKTVEANMGKALKAFRHSLKDYMCLF
ncbi:RNA polymerase sigma-70 factor [Ancylomarina sp. 16SWW S1-10-2]|uniref:RNA polymerase sigma-70 factor n=1 Tax=Ancylomarina sp. 16SWW S1-10-2 TaxID=2499681 RepID=UPI0012AD770A|nr:RNA polymerase sigma-70 factor [Ancylomarina sp. 16SWW S1-10-2]MRT93218.1 RNA polymerase sigma-70 factor [Ancylomarina sp. 16SWW S1-10-2]